MANAKVLKTITESTTLGNTKTTVTTTIETVEVAPALRCITVGEAVAGQVIDVVVGIKTDRVLVLNKKCHLVPQYQGDDTKTVTCARTDGSILYVRANRTAYVHSEPVPCDDSIVYKGN